MRSRMSHRHVTSAGFTVIELMIVVAVVIVLSASVAITLPRFEGDNLLVAATRVQTAIDTSRQAAISHRIPWAVTFDVANNKVAYSDSDLTSRSVEFPSMIGFPAYFGHFSTDEVSVYISTVGSNYVYSDMTNSPVLTFNGFGRPDIGRLDASRPPVLASLTSGYGVVTLETKGGSRVIQVLIYADTGRTELRWIRR